MAGQHDPLDSDCAVTFDAVHSGAVWQHRTWEVVGAICASRETIIASGPVKAKARRANHKCGETLVLQDKPLRRVPNTLAARVIVCSILRRRSRGSKGGWACPDLRSGRVLSRGRNAARPSRLRRLGPFGSRPLTRSKRRGRQLVSGHRARCEHVGGALNEPPWPQPAGWSDGGTATSSRPVAMRRPIPPPIDAPRVRQPSARGNPPAAGPPLRSGPSEQARLGATGERLPRWGA